MDNLVSGMVLVDNLYGNLHYFVTTPMGYRVITCDSECVEFNPKQYKKAYIPVDYNDLWTPMKSTEIELYPNAEDEDNELTVTAWNERIDSIENCLIQREENGPWENAIRFNEGSLGYIDMWGKPIDEVWDIKKITIFKIRNIQSMLNPSNNQIE